MLSADAILSGYGLPRDYYFLNDTSLEAYYVQHIANTLALVQELPSAADVESQLPLLEQAGHIYQLEVTLASAALPAAERRDPAAMYHMLSVQALKELAPSFDWDSYLAAIGMPDGIQQANVIVPSYFQALDTTIQTTDFAVLRNYLVCRLSCPSHTLSHTHTHILTHPPTPTLPHPAPPPVSTEWSSDSGIAMEIGQEC